MTISQKLIQRVEGQSGLHRSESETAIFFDETKLPSMFPTNDWNISATKQWGLEELTMLQHSSDQDVSEGLADADPWVCMAGIAEIIMHGEEQRAMKLAREIIAINPDHRETFLSYFGQEITNNLLEE